MKNITGFHVRQQRICIKTGPSFHLYRNRLKYAPKALHAGPPPTGKKNRRILPVAEVYPAVYNCQYYALFRTFFTTSSICSADRPNSLSRSTAGPE